MPGFVNYKKGCTPLASVSDKVYQLLAHGRWFSPGTPASSTTKTGRHDIAEILLKVALNIKSNHNQIVNFATTFSITTFCLYVLAYMMLELGLWHLTPLQQYFSIVAVSFIGGGNRSTRKSLTSFIT